MSKAEKIIETLPPTVPVEAKPPRRTLKAGPEAVTAWKAMVAAAQAEAEAVAAETKAAERAATEAGLRDAVRVAEARGEQPERGDRGSVIVARDGLRWLTRKGKILPVHERAGLRFRADWERANGTGVMSSLSAEGGAGYGPKSGPTDAMLTARDNVRSALAALGTPMLAPYAELVAGEGVMLNRPPFVTDPRRVEDHVLPCVIAFDLLARHYGMIR